jgi:hypothetical protein
MSRQVEHPSPPEPHEHQETMTLVTKMLTMNNLHSTMPFLKGEQATSAEPYGCNAFG